MWGTAVLVMGTVWAAVLPELAGAGAPSPWPALPLLVLLVLTGLLDRRGASLMFAVVWSAVGGTALAATDRPAQALGTVAVLFAVAAPSEVVAARLRRFRFALDSALDDVADLSGRDPATGLLDRRGFAVETSLALADAQRTSRLATVLWLGLDGLTAPGPRDVLTVAVDAVRGSVRPGDGVGRLAPREIGVLLPAPVNLAEAWAVAERVSDAVAAATAGQVTASIGYAAARDEDVEDLLARAARAMHAARSAGQGGIRLAGPARARTPENPPDAETPQGASDASASV